MKRLSMGFTAAVGLLALLGSAGGAAAQDAKTPGSQLIAIYQIAPGKHLDFLKWMASQQAVAKEAGAAATMWYAHTDGASWDYISITPQPDAARSAEIDKKSDAIAKQKGLPTGFKASLQFRQFVASHTDTYSMGPMTADEMVKAATQ
ncbi:MAG: hypothetical protein ABIT01_08035 [Thermoanaerobaculia bacterium]